MDDPFAPISSQPAPGTTSSPNKAKWSPVAPIPKDAPARPKKHPALGAPSREWVYLDADCAPLFYICRFDSAVGKEFRPLALYRAASGGTRSWRWESHTAPRAIYRLEELAARPGAPVIVAEGEKAADAAAELLPAFVATTSPNGSKSAAKADWGPLRGRDVIIWPDADAAGLAYAEDVAALALGAGAQSVAISAPPAGAEVGFDAADALAAGWTQSMASEFIASALPYEAETPIATVSSSEMDERDDLGKGKRRRRPSRDALIGLTDAAAFWHAPDSTAYATFPVKGHKETWRVGSAQYRRWLIGQAYEQAGAVPGGQAIEDAIRFLEARAINDGPTRIPMLRVGEIGDRWYIDLCDDQHRAIEIRADGWSILENHDLPFLRTAAMQPLPVPEQGEMIETLRGFVNVASDADFMMVVGWTLAALCPCGPYPIMCVQGEHGSGKSILAQLLRSVIDPNVAPVRSAPKDETDLIVAAKNGHVVALDNLSKVDANLSDALCRISTGGGFSSRQKFTDSEEFVVWCNNPIVLNGIGSLADRADLASRAIIVRLDAIPDDARRNLREFWTEWGAAAPRVLGALCDALSTARKNLSEVKQKKASRMADFELLMLAAAPAFGWGADDFFDAYAAQRRDLESSAIDADAVAVAIIEMMRDDCPEGWEGTPTRLLELLGAKVSETIRRSRTWPQSVNILGNRLERAKPLLRQRGINLQRVHSGKRIVVLMPLPGYQP